jgi:hypothetical protein
MVIEFEPKPQPTAAVNKPVAPKKFVEVDHSDTVQAMKPPASEDWRDGQGTVEKSGELF